MKRLPLLLLVLLLLGASAPRLPHVHDLAFTADLHAQQDPAKLTVYITRTGEKYHRDGCQHLRQSRIPISLKDATARGFGACKVCKPPTM